MGRAIEGKRLRCASDSEIVVGEELSGGWGAELMRGGAENGGNAVIRYRGVRDIRLWWGNSDRVYRRTREGTMELANGASLGRIG